MRMRTLGAYRYCTPILHAAADADQRARGVERGEVNNAVDDAHACASAIPAYRAIVASIGPARGHGPYGVALLIVVENDGASNAEIVAYGQRVLAREREVPPRDASAAHRAGAWVARELRSVSRSDVAVLTVPLVGAIVLLFHRYGGPEASHQITVLLGGAYGFSLDQTHSSRPPCQSRPQDPPQCAATGG